MLGGVAVEEGHKRGEGGGVAACSVGWVGVDTFPVVCSARRRLVTHNDRTAVTQE